VLSLTGVRASGPATVSQLTAPAGPPPAPPAPGIGRFGGPPTTLAQSTLAEVPRRITVPPASMTVYQFEVR